MFVSANAGNLVLRIGVAKKNGGRDHRHVRSLVTHNKANINYTFDLVHARGWTTMMMVVSVIYLMCAHRVKRQVVRSMPRKWVLAIAHLILGSD